MQLRDPQEIFIKIVRIKSYYKNMIKKGEIMAKSFWEIKPTSFIISPKKPGKTSCPKTIRDQLRVKWWKGKYEGSCFCCGRKISYEHVEAGRIKAGGKYSVPNTRLICKTCNRGMGKTNLKVYMKRNYPERYTKYFPKSEIKKIRKKKTMKNQFTYWSKIKLPKSPKIRI